MNELTREIAALFSLLDDPQPLVQAAVFDRLFHIGEESVPILLELSDAKRGENRDRVEEFIKQLRIRMATQRLTAAFDRPDTQIELEEGVFILAKFGFPDLDTITMRSQLDDMARDIAILSGTRSTAFERFMRLRSYLFTELGFLGNREDYYNPDNSFMNKVLESRRGIPISLSTLMMLLGQRLDIPLKGIGMPMHFLLQYDDGTRSFYIDPFTSGMIITTEQCEAMLSSSGIKLTPDMLAPVSNRDILERMWRNLYLAYQQTSQPDQSAIVADLLKLVSPEFEINDFGSDEEDDDEEEEF